MRKIFERLLAKFKREPKIDAVAWLKRARAAEDKMEGLCKILKCKPDEVLIKINKIQTNIADLEAQIKKFEEAKLPIDKSK